MGSTPHAYVAPGDHRKPSKVEHGDLYTLRIYLDTGGDPQVYDDVKHLWWTASDTVLTVLQYTGPEAPDREHRYVYWPRESIRWYQFEPQRFGDQGE